MKKWFMALLVVVVVGAFLVPAFAETTAKLLNPEQQQEVNKLVQEEYQIRAQIIDKYLEAGVITADQAADAKARLKSMYDNRKAQGIVPGTIYGGRGGCGSGGGMGGNSGTLTPQNNTL